MILTSLCYLEYKEHYLMLHRIKKKQDVNQGKWIGLGGKFEAGETPEACVNREVYEESGFRMERCRLRGILTFQAEGWETEYIFVYTSDLFQSDTGMDQNGFPILPPCPEGELAWIPKNKLMDLQLWEGDRIFLKLLTEESPFFSMKLCYQGDVLKEYTLKLEEK